MQRHVVLFRRMARPLAQRGSAYMRAEQLVELLRPDLDPGITLSVRPFHALVMPPIAMRAVARSIPRGALCIFVKSAAKHLTRAHLAPLRKRGITVAQDVVDMKLRHVRPELFDLLIAASLRGQQALRDLCADKGLSCPVELLHHHFDPRLQALPLPERPEFSCGYIGRPDNAMIPEAIRGEVETVDISVVEDFERALPRIGRFALHYGVRPESQTAHGVNRGYKPFTKGFTAAACKANILVNRDVDDAVEMLGADYPFLTDPTPESITETFRLAQDSYGGPLWRDALDRMEAMRATVEPAALARQLTEIITRAAPLG
ncbi:hypothetical protein [Thioclava sp. F28-4]|uniref:hypothetical protein n=1 Tax=Thioclava sp. F28-4 TaxID=1915315 RepID=UPI0011BAAA1D|nr:hypothetical protein [Thioclava sp. F28-4]